MIIIALFKLFYHILKMILTIFFFILMTNLCVKFLEDDANVASVTSGVDIVYEGGEDKENNL